MLKRVLQSKFVANLAGAAAFGWLWLVRRTTRFVVEPADVGHLRSDEPIIVATWHGQQLMVAFACSADTRASALVSRSADGEIIANVLSRFGVQAIRGSGGAGAKSRKRGGVVALRQMLKSLAEGSNVALTADVPKVSRVCGEGIVTLARLSGRPIYPFAVVCRWRINFKSWDRASLGLPFGRGAMVYGAPIRVPADADAAALEAARKAVESGLDQIVDRAHALIGAVDPGAGLALRLDHSK